MTLQQLSEYINTNAPMTNLPELLSLHHGNPLGFHPLVLPLVILALTVGMHVVIHRVHYKEHNRPSTLIYVLLALTVVATYYYAFCDDLPLFEDWQLKSTEICIGWFCQRSIVGVAWSIVGVMVLTYAVCIFISTLMLVLAQMSDKAGIEENQWKEWRHVLITMLVGASAAGVADDFAPITGIWIMIGYQFVVLVMIVMKVIYDMARTRKFWHCLLIGVCYFITFEAITMWVIECIEGYIYLFVPLVCLFATVSNLYRKKVKD